MRIYFKIIFFNFLLMFSLLSYSQDETTVSSRPKNAPRGDKHKNVFDSKGKQGLWKYYSNDKILLFEITYKNDIKHGVSTRYYSTNGLIREEVTYFYGKKDGEYKSYYNNGQLSAEGAYKNGMKSGKWTMYSKSSGEKKSEGEYLNNKREGEWAIYSTKGGKLSEGKYTNGVKNGEWTFYDEEGKFKQKIVYSKGTIKEKEEAPKTPVQKTTKPKAMPAKKITGN